MFVGEIMNLGSNFITLGRFMFSNNRKLIFCRHFFWAAQSTLVCLYTLGCKNLLFSLVPFTVAGWKNSPFISDLSTWRQNEFLAVVSGRDSETKAGQFHLRQFFVSTNLWLLMPPWDPQHRKDTGLWERIQRRTTKTVTGMEHLSC